MVGDTSAEQPFSPRCSSAKHDPTSDSTALSGSLVHQLASNRVRPGEKLRSASDACGGDAPKQAHTRKLIMISPVISDFFFPTHCEDFNTSALTVAMSRMRSLSVIVCKFFQHFLKTIANRVGQVSWSNARDCALGFRWVGVVPTVPWSIDVDDDNNILRSRSERR